MIPRFLSRWLAKPRIAALDREIEAALARRKAGRAARQEAARKGWQTRRMHNG